MHKKGAVVIKVFKMAGARTADPNPKMAGNNETGLQHDQRGRRMGYRPTTLLSLMHSRYFLYIIILISLSIKQSNFLCLKLLVGYILYTTIYVNGTFSPADTLC